MQINRVLKVVAAWFFGSLIFCFVFLYIANPLPGLFLLTLVWSVVIAVVGPPVYLLFDSKRDQKHDGWLVAKNAFLTIIVMVLILFALGMTGLFNFT